MIGMKTINMKTKLTDESGSILISSLVFLMVISLLLSGLGMIIINESRQQEMIKDNYLAKTMIQKSYYILEERSLEDLSETSRDTVHFNHGKVLIQQVSDGYFTFTAELTNQYQYQQSNRLFNKEDLDELESDIDEENDQELDLEADSDFEENKLKQTTEDQSLLIEEDALKNESDEEPDQESDQGNLINPRSKPDDN